MNRVNKLLVEQEVVTQQGKEVRQLNRRTSLGGELCEKKDATA